MGDWGSKGTHLREVRREALAGRDGQQHGRRGLHRADRHQRPGLGCEMGVGLSLVHPLYHTEFDRH
jgi:hypothetical protein